MKKIPLSWEWKLPKKPVFKMFSDLEGIKDVISLSYEKF